MTVPQLLQDDPAWGVFVFALAVLVPLAVSGFLWWTTILYYPILYANRPRRRHRAIVLNGVMTVLLVVGAVGVWFGVTILWLQIVCGAALVGLTGWHLVACRREALAVRGAASQCPMNP